jgi:glycosyltransferase involved in cell wall biosynthesis
MRITLVSPFDPIPPSVDGRNAHVGGVERVYAELARGLVRRRHEVTLVCSTSEASSATRQDGIQVVRASRRATVFRAPVAELAKHLPVETDLVQVAATYPFTTPGVLKRARQLNVPSVLDFHFEPAPGTRLGRMASALYRGIGPRAYGFADAVIVRSYAYGRWAKSLARVPESRWRIVPNGIDTNRFQAIDAPTRDYVLFVGRLVPYKGVEVLLRALFLLRPNVPLVVAGDGPLRPRLQELARRLQVDVRFLGHVPDEDLPRLYANARVTVLPSVTGQEAFGIALVESMACGTPVIASSLPGVADVARLGGLVAQTGDAQSLANQLSAALDGAALPQGPPLAKRIHASFSWDAVTDRVVDVYREILERRAGGPRPAEVTSAAHPGRHTVL